MRLYLIETVYKIETKLNPPVLPVIAHQCFQDGLFRVINDGDYGRTGVGGVTRLRSNFKVIGTRRSEKQRLAGAKQATLTGARILEILARWQSAIPVKDPRTSAFCNV